MIDMSKTVKNQIRSQPTRQDACGKSADGAVRVSYRETRGGQFILRIEDTDQERFYGGGPGHYLPARWKRQAWSTMKAG